MKASSSSCYASALASEGVLLGDLLGAFFRELWAAALADAPGPDSVPAASFAVAALRRPEPFSGAS